MIVSFGNKLAEDFFYDISSKEVRSFPPTLHRICRRKLLYLHDAEDVKDLKVPPGNKLEALRGDLKGFYSIRINDQWRLIFRFDANNAFDVAVVDYH